MLAMIFWVVCCGVLAWMAESFGVNFRKFFILTLCTSPFLGLFIIYEYRRMERGLQPFWKDIFREV